MTPRRDSVFNKKIFHISANKNLLGSVQFVQISRGEMKRKKSILIMSVHEIYNDNFLSDTPKEFIFTAC